MDWQQRLLQTTQEVDIQPYITPREFAILELRYNRFLSLEQIGKKIGVTRERIRQIEKKALHKLQHYREKIIFNDYFKAEQELKEKHQALINELTQEINSLGEIKLWLEMMPKGLYDYFHKPICKQNIEVLNLSVRGYNCLKRANINTIEDLLKKSEEDLQKIRNMGSHTLYEIKSKLKELGLESSNGNN